MVECHRRELWQSFNKRICRVVQCESKGFQSTVQRCHGYPFLHLQTCQDLCVVQDNAAGNRQQAAQSKLRELRQWAPARCKGPQDQLFHALCRWRTAYASLNRKSHKQWGYVETTGILRWASVLGTYLKENPSQNALRGVLSGATGYKTWYFLILFSVTN